ncbi:hypothetical protein MMC25_000307 [Agyrium rufum]|nr:hypothetical protein [Agyrium rufum]
MADLQYAAKEKITEDHEVIDEAIQERAEGYTVFSIPVGMVYRPNSAKVKNLKTKDYLGRARLVAAADRGNVTIGFAGADQKRAAKQNLDERPPEQISFAAQNLVRPDLVSRSSQRQQSAPPGDRNVFPPTPPPENAQPVPKMPSARANSVKNGPRPPVPPQAQAQQPQQSPQAPEPLRPRVGTTRTASEPRGPPARQNTGSRSQRGGEESQQGRERLYREMPNEEDEEQEDLYDLYRDTASANPYGAGQDGRRRPSSDKPRRRSRSRQPVPDYIDENDEAPSPSVDSSLDDFEILNNAGGALSRPLRDESRSRGTSRTRRQIDVRTVRVKLHNGEDTRYLMVSTTILYEEFLDRVRDKLEIQKRFKVRIRDEGDLITMGDRDDWDLAVSMARKDARKTGADLAKMELWVVEM